MTRARLVIAALILASTTTTAQVRVIRYGDDRLKGITEVDVLVTTSANTECAVSRLAVQQRAVRTLHAAGIKATISERATSSPYSIVIALSSVARAAQCAGAITTELVAQVSGIPESDGSLTPGAWGSILVGKMPLLQDDGLVIGRALEHDAAVQQAVEAHVVAVAARIRSVNP